MQWLHHNMTSILKGIFIAMIAGMVAMFAMSLIAANPALAAPAAPSGDGGAIQTTIDNARGWLATIMLSLGGLGMIASIAVKAVARTNENMHHAAHMGMTGSAIAIIAGLLVDDIISLLQSFVGGGGGGG